MAAGPSQSPVVEGRGVIGWIAGAGRRIIAWIEGEGRWKGVEVRKSVIHGRKCSEQGIIGERFAIPAGEEGIQFVGNPVWRVFVQWIGGCWRRGVGGAGEGVWRGGGG